MAGISTQHPSYSDMFPQWKKCADVERGQRAVHAAGSEYLPKNGAESDTDYKARIKRSDFFNAFYRTVSGLSGMAFAKDPAIDLPGALDSYKADIDLAGTTLVGMAKDVVEDVLEYGRIGLLVDYPAMPENVSAITQMTAEQMGLRPALKTYEAKSIVNWKTMRIGNRTVLAMVVLKECHMIAKDEFEDEKEERYRVLDLDEAGHYRQRVFVEKAGKAELLETIYPVMNRAKLAFIPFRIIGVNGMGFDVEEPPLIDLVDANIAHYQVNSDIRVAMHFGVPTFCISGYTPVEGETITVGSRAAIILPDPMAKAYFAEPQGEMLPQMQAALKEIEQRMAILGARMIADETRQAETLGATQIKRAGENSVMASLVLAVSDAFEWALGIMAQWAGVSGDIVFQINREFNPLGLTAQDLQAVFAGVQQGIISEREAFDLLQRGDMIDGEKLFEEHQEEIAQQGPAALTLDPVAQGGMVA